ncbi:MAG: hypothetical protein AAGC78_05050 [Cellvibrio sp.]|uniref:hypothetical protein n=1 Tax=Cellvibrio sp. TaxID=1965322 RepID=UPI0031A22555
MIKMPDKKPPVEISGAMSTKGADRVGLLMAIGWMLDKLLWRIILIIAVVIMMNVEAADAAMIALEIVDPVALHVCILKMQLV